MSERWPQVKLRDVLTQVVREVAVDPTATYSMVGVLNNGRGVYFREQVEGSSIGYKTLYVARAGDFLVSRVKAWEGSVGVVPQEFDGFCCSVEFPCFESDYSRVIPAYLALAFKTDHGARLLREAARGIGARRERVKEDQFLSIEIPLPPIEVQRETIRRYDQVSIAQEIVQNERALYSQLEQIGVRWLEQQVNAMACSDHRLDGLLCDGITNGIAAKPDPDSGTHRILRISAATTDPLGRVNLSDARFLDATPSEVARFSLVDGDVLVCRFNGNRKFVGKMALCFSPNDALLYPDKLMRLRVDRQKIHPEFLVAASQLPTVRQQIDSEIRTTAGNLGINGRMLGRVRIPLPKVDQQIALARRFARIQTQALSVRTHIQESDEDFCILRRAIVESVMSL